IEPLDAVNTRSKTRVWCWGLEGASLFSGEALTSRLLPFLWTFVSAFTVLCGARTDLPDRHMCCVFWLNIAAALIQILTAIVMVGWIMSIFWGMDMVILASKYGAIIVSTPTLLGLS
uniref:Stum, mechanosensory transduction mediator homolog n=1 Tax=Terrapene triunguis TaxID=2587831 RepID=A0A674J6P8_9SAUR